MVLCWGFWFRWLVPSAPQHRRVLGERVRTYRERAKFSQEKLAEKANLAVVFISLVENGWRTISVDSLLRIAKAFLELDLRYLNSLRGSQTFRDTKGSRPNPISEKWLDR
jgi:transcriptional regulator with XRE-family HTH domain